MEGSQIADSPVVSDPEESALVDGTSPGVHWHVAPAWKSVLLGPQGLRLDEWLAEGRVQIVKHASHRTVYRIELPDHAFYVKHYRVLAFLNAATHLLRGQRGPPRIAQCPGSAPPQRPHRDADCPGRTFPGRPGAPTATSSARPSPHRARWNVMPMNASPGFLRTSRHGCDCGSACRWRGCVPRRTAPASITPIFIAATCWWVWTRSTRWHRWTICRRCT